jgi:hypothetical protein
VVQPFDLGLETAGWELESTADESSGKHIRLLVVKSTRRNSVGVARSKTKNYLLTMPSWVPRSFSYAGSQNQL